GLDCEQAPRLQRITPQGHGEREDEFAQDQPSAHDRPEGGQDDRIDHEEAEEGQLVPGGRAAEEVPRQRSSKCHVHEGVERMEMGTRKRNNLSMIPGPGQPIGAVEGGHPGLVEVRAGHKVMYPVMANRSWHAFSPATWVLALAAAVLAATATAQTPPPANPEVAARAETVVADMAAGRFDEVYERFDQKMRAALPAAKLAAGWNAVRQASGSFDSVVSTATSTREGYEIAVVTCAFERTNVEVQVVFNGAGEIAGLAMRPGQARDVAGLPSYAEPARYTESDVTVGSGQWALLGTLTMPVGDGPFPAVVL